MLLSLSCKALHYYCITFKLLTPKFTTTNTENKFLKGLAMLNMNCSVIIETFGVHYLFQSYEKN